jgi:hypothetical protein
MKAPRFRLRTLVVLIAFAALVMTIVVTRRENARLRAELNAARQQSGFITFTTSYLTAFPQGNGTVVNFASPTLFQLSTAGSVDQPPAPASAPDSMPNGLDAFAHSPGDK